jgi:outer membrane receptor for ferrienterochelin and colicins
MRKAGPAVVLVLVVSGLATEVHAAASGPAPCTVEGVVRDVTGAVLPGVAVVVTPGGAEATTGVDGRYCVPGSTSPAREVIARLAGFQTVAQPVPHDGPPPLRLDLRLAPAGLEERIVVTGTRTRRRLEDVPVRTELVTREDLEVRAPATLADAVEFTTGVRVENDCQNCNFSQLRLLGLEGPYTQILIDGQPLLSSLAQVYGIEQIPARMIDRIEVVKGGGSALYGPGSVGGVVNVLPREATRTGGSLEAEGEPADRDYSAAGGVDLAPRSGRTALAVFGQSQIVNPRDLDDDGFTEVARRRLASFGARAARETLAGRGRVVVDLSRVREERRGGDRLERPPHEAEITEAVDNRRDAASLTWRHTASRTFDYRLTASFAHTDRDSYYGAGRDPNAYGNSASDLIVLDSQLNHFLGRHVLSWGAQYTRDALRDEQPAYSRHIDQAYADLGFYAQDAWSFARGLELVVGARYDRHDALSDGVLSPRAALAWGPSEDLDLRASVASGFRAPVVFDEDLHIMAVGGTVSVVRNAPDLRPETSWNFMLGGEWRPELLGGRGMLEANGFYTPLDELFFNAEQDDPGTPELEFSKVNLGSARVYGVELNAGWGRGSDVVIEGGVVFQRSRFGTPEPDFGSRDFFRTPARYGKLTLTAQGPFGTRLFAGLRYTGPMWAPHYAGFVPEDRLERAPSFVTLDVNLSRSFALGKNARLSVAFLGRNLTEAYQRDVDRGPLRDAGYVYGPRFPRRLRLQAAVAF